MGWTGRGNDVTVAVSLSQQRIEHLKGWVEGSPGQLERARRFAALSSAPWQEARTPLSGNLFRFERETVVEDAGGRFAAGDPGFSAKIVTVRVYPLGGTAALSELTTVLTEHP